MGDTIEVGDLVDVYFDSVECEIALRVLHTPHPHAIGDSWQFKRTSVDGSIVYVLDYSKMVKRHEAKKENSR